MLHISTSLPPSLCPGPHSVLECCHLGSSTCTRPRLITQNTEYNHSRRLLPNKKQNCPKHSALLHSLLSRHQLFILSKPSEWGPAKHEESGIQTIQTSLWQNNFVWRDDGEMEGKMESQDDDSYVTLRDLHISLLVTALIFSRLAPPPHWSRGDSLSYHWVSPAEEICQVLLFVVWGQCWGGSPLKCAICEHDQRLGSQTFTCYTTRL